MRRAGYYVYGEGARSCRGECGEPGWHLHPTVIREQWPNRRAYWAARFWAAVAHRTARFYIPSWAASGQTRGPVGGWFGFIADRAWPKVPRVHLDLPDKDSIYEKVA